VAATNSPIAINREPRRAQPEIIVLSSIVCSVDPVCKLSRWNRWPKIRQARNRMEVSGRAGYAVISGVLRVHPAGWPLLELMLALYMPPL